MGDFYPYQNRLFFCDTGGGKIVLEKKSKEDGSLETAPFAALRTQEGKKTLQLKRGDESSRCTFLSGENQIRGGGGGKKDEGERKRGKRGNGNTIRWHFQISFPGKKKKGEKTRRKKKKKMGPSSVAVPISRQSVEDRKRKHVSPGRDLRGERGRESKIHSWLPTGPFTTR